MTEITKDQAAEIALKHMRDSTPPPEYTYSICEGTSDESPYGTFYNMSEIIPPVHCWIISMSPAYPLRFGGSSQVVWIDHRTGRIIRSGVVRGE